MIVEQEPEAESATLIALAEELEARADEANADCEPDEIGSLAGEADGLREAAQLARDYASREESDDG